jgi:hypothetical protein
MVVIARKGAGELEWTAIDAELLGGVAKLGCKLSGKLNQSVPMPGPERRSD